MVRTPCLRFPYRVVAPRGEPPATDDGGFTLVEVLITVALMSIAFVAILGSLGTMIASGSSHRAVTTAEVAIRDLAEFVKSDTSVAYQDCGATPAPLASYTDAVDAGYTPPTGFSASVLSVTSWQGDSAGTFNATCPTPDAGAQLVRLRVTGGHGGRTSTQEAEIVKRRP